MSQLINDFTFVESVFSRRLRHQRIHTRRLRTIHVRFTASYTSGKHLVSLGGLGDVEGILRSIFKRYDENEQHFVILILDLSRKVVGFKLLASGTEAPRPGR